MLTTYIAFLKETNTKSSIELLNPLPLLGEYDVKAVLNTSLVSAFENGNTGIFGKCVLFYDPENRSFILDGKMHPEYRFHSNMAEINLPRIAYENGGSLGFHRNILPHDRSIVKFGGARYFLHDEGFYFFHESGDFGPMPADLTKMCVEGSNARLHKQGLVELTPIDDTFTMYFLENVGGNFCYDLRNIDRFESSSFDDSSPDDDLPF